MASFRKRGDFWYFRYQDATGNRPEKKGFRDKRETERLAYELENRVVKEKARTIDPKEELLTQQARRPLAEHVAEFHAYLLDKGNTTKHADTTRTWINTVTKIAAIEDLDDLAVGRVQKAIAALGKPNKSGRALSLRTLNAYATAIKSFSRWLWQDGRAREDALMRLTKFNEATDRRYSRRPLTQEELHKLVKAAASGPKIGAMSGQDRAVLYTLAFNTGFRVSELRSLRRESFRLDGDYPHVVCEPAYTKNGKAALQPITIDLAQSLSDYLKTKPANNLVFQMPDKPAKMLRADLEGAGISYETKEGIVDFHSLRHTFVTHLVNSNISIKTAQTLARHSDPKLTMNVYAHADQEQQCQAVSKLTNLAPLLPRAGDATVRTQSHIEGEAQPSQEQGDVEQPQCFVQSDAISRIGSQSTDSAPRRTRTYNPLIKSQESDFLNPLQDKDLRQEPESLAPLLPRDADLALIVESWDQIPASVRRGIIAMVRDARSV